MLFSNSPSAADGLENDSESRLLKLIANHVFHIIRAVSLPRPVFATAMSNVQRVFERQSMLDLNFPPLDVGSAALVLAAKQLHFPGKVKQVVDKTIKQRNRRNGQDLEDVNSVATKEDFDRIFFVRASNR